MRAPDTTQGAVVRMGESYVIEPGHDASVVGDDRFAGFEFESRPAEEYAKGWSEHPLAGALTSRSRFMPSG